MSFISTSAPLARALAERNYSEPTPVQNAVLEAAAAGRDLLVSSQTGRNFIAVRDNETAARIIGVPVLRTKLLAFGVSSFIIGVAGVLWAFAYLRTVEPAGFNLDRSFQILFIVTTSLLFNYHMPF